MMHVQPGYWIAGGIALLTVIVAAIAEARRARRPDLDQTGWVPWRGIQVVAVFALVFVLILAFHR